MPACRSCARSPPRTRPPPRRSPPPWSSSRSLPKRRAAALPSSRPARAGADVTLVEFAEDEMVERLAEAIARRVGFRRIDVVPKVSACLAQLHPTERFGYAGHLMTTASNDPTWLDFIERLLIHETYFFRHPAQLELLRDQVLPELD